MKPIISESRAGWRVQFLDKCSDPPKRRNRYFSSLAEAVGFEQTLLKPVEKFTKEQLDGQFEQLREYMEKAWDSDTIAVYLALEDARKRKHETVSL